MKRASAEDREKWRGVIAEQASGGQTAAAFCRGRGISLNSFYAWRRRLGGSEAGAFAELKVSPASIAERGFGGVEVSLCNQRRLIVHCGFDRELLVELIRTLEALA